MFLTDTGDDSKVVHQRERPKVDTLFSSLFSDTSEHRVENTRVHFWTFSPVLVNRYTTNEKKSLHNWRGALASFRSAQHLSAMNISESQIFRKKVF